MRMADTRNNIFENFENLVEYYFRQWVTQCESINESAVPKINQDQRTRIKRHYVKAALKSV